MHEPQPPSRPIKYLSRLPAARQPRIYGTMTRVERAEEREKTREKTDMTELKRMFRLNAVPPR